MIPKLPDERGKRHDNRAIELIAHEAAKFIAEEAGNESLITVTRAVLSSHGDHATVFISVFPEEKVRSALSFLERQREALSDHLKERTRLKPLPRIEFVYDAGEKNRQRLDELGKAL